MAYRAAGTGGYQREDSSIVVVVAYHIEQLHAHDGTSLAISLELPSDSLCRILRVSGLGGVQNDHLFDRYHVF